MSLPVASPPIAQRVLLVHQFFAPDVTTYAQMLDAYAAHLVSLGHEVTVVCGPPSYNGAYDGPPPPRREVKNGYCVRRLPIPPASNRYGKLLAGALFPVAVVLFAWLRRRSFDVISVTTVPPVVMGIAGRLASGRSRSSRFVYHCMDIYPEVARAIGVERTGITARLSRAIDNRTVGAARPAVVLSEDMKRTLEHRGADVSGVVVENNFIIHSVTQDPVVRPPESGFRLVFAGNVGRFQGLELIADAVAELVRRKRNIEVLFLGNGAMVADLQQRAAAESLPMSFEAHRPIDEAANLMADADLAIVSLAPGVIEAAYPSKTMMYLELGLPVLAAVGSDSELAHLIADSSAGVVPESLTSGAIADAVERAMATDFDRQKIQKIGRELFDRELVLGRWTTAYGLDGATP